MIMSKSVIENDDIVQKFYKFKCVLSGLPVVRLPSRRIECAIITTYMVSSGWGN